jgi:hypothetical protein
MNTLCASLRTYSISSKQMALFHHVAPRFNLEDSVKIAFIALSVPCSCAYSKLPFASERGLFEIRIARSPTVAARSSDRKINREKRHAAN